MRIATYEYAGDVSFGIVDGDSVIDRRQLGIGFKTAVEFIASGAQLVQPIEQFNGERIPLTNVTFLPPITPRKILCAGVNFPTHRQETGNDPKRPAHPTIFTRFTDTHVGHGQPIRRPAETERFDYEGELVVVIGRRAWQVSAVDAENYVFGYSIYNDGSVRDWQRHSGQWIPGKNFLESGAFGPWIVSADGLPNLPNAQLRTHVNGDLRQEALIGDMVFSVAELIEYVTTFTPLDAGDCIVAGTPGGVGAYMEPPGLLSDGDVVSVSIDGIGTLTNRIVQA